ILSLSGLFLFLSLPLSENTAYEWNRIELKGPVLGLAIAFATIGRIEKRYYHLLLALYVMMCITTAAFTMVNYILSYEVVNESYLRAKVMPSLINHVRYSIIVAMGCYISYYLYQQNFRWGIWSRKVFLCIALALFLFLHF